MIASLAGCDINFSKYPGELFGGYCFRELLIDPNVLFCMTEETDHHSEEFVPNVQSHILILLFSKVRHLCLEISCPGSMAKKATYIFEDLGEIKSEQVESIGPQRSLSA